MPIAFFAAAVLAALSPSPAADAPSFGYPVAGPARATSGFGLRVDPFTGRNAFHAGLDFAAPVGTPVLAAKPGRIESVSEGGGYGLKIQIDHGGAVRSVYSQLSRIDVKEGDVVAQGQTIGAAGNSGRSTGPHLHLEIWDGETVVDPAPLIAWTRRSPVVPD